MIHVVDYEWTGDGFTVEWRDDRQNGLVGYTHVTAEWVEDLYANLVRPARGGNAAEYAQLRNVLRDGFQPEDLPVVVAWWRQQYEQTVYDRLDAKQSGQTLAEYMRSRRRN